MFCFPRFQSVNPHSLTQADFRSVSGGLKNLAVSRWTSCSSSSGEEREQCPPKLPGPPCAFCLQLRRAFSVCLATAPGIQVIHSGSIGPNLGPEQKTEMEIGTTFKDVVTRHRRIITSLFPVVKIATLDQQVGILYLKSRLLFSCKNDGNSGTCTMWMDLLVIMQMK